MSRFRDYRPSNALVAAVTALRAARERLAASRPDRRGVSDPAAPLPARGTENEKAPAGGGCSGRRSAGGVVLPPVRGEK